MKLAAMTPEQKSAHYRAIGAKGGRATVARHGTAHMSAIGKVGFAAALETIGGVELAKILAGSYRAKYGRDFDIARAINHDAVRERAAARRAHPHLGGCERAGCPNNATDRHHRYGIRGGHARAAMQFLCRDCHQAHHRTARATRRAQRPRVGVVRAAV